MNFDAYLQALQDADSYEDQIAHVERIPACEAIYGELERPLALALRQALERIEVRRLYAHQAEAVNAAREGCDVTVVTATASGKTLCYNLPVIDVVLTDPMARALYLFPTRALAQDQLGKLNDFGLFPKVRFATYDSDTGAAERQYIKKSAQIVLTNPDMLHIGILPYHRTWSTFFANLRYVVVDELHSYRGVFGAHVAQVLRRLRRICTLYGSEPKFLCCSATIANPDELTQKLTGVLRPVIVDSNGAPAGRRTFVFWNPPFTDEKRSARKSTNLEVTTLFTDLVESGVRSIAFTRARKSAELILRYARGVFDRRDPALSRRITSYRAGYTREERREIEAGLSSGALLGVTATNALELGVDIGGLDAAVLTGYPGTVASTWQQAGRAGRAGGEALAVLVAYDNPLDQFLMRHPDYFFGRPHERAVIDPNNRRILARHLLCAAYERALEPACLMAFGPNARGAVETLVEEKKLIFRTGKWHCAQRSGAYPAADVNIRSASDGTFSILDSTRGDRLVGTVESGFAHKAIHEGAIYLHLGETYLVEKLDLATRIARVSPHDAVYFTEPRESSHILILDTMKRRPLGCTVAYFGEVVVTNRVSAFRRRRLFSDEVLEIVPLELPEQTFETEAFWFTVPEAVSRKLVDEGWELGGSIHAVEHAAIGMMPLLCTCDRNDLGGVSHPEHPDTALPTIFVHDAYPGGVGIAEATYHMLHDLLAAALAVITDCPCAGGCPSCVQSPKCGGNNEPLDKIGARRLLEMLLAELKQ